MEEKDSPRWMEMPSISEASPEPERPPQAYHDLGDLYPDAPVPMHRGEVVIHRGLLKGPDGIPALTDWVAAGDVAIVELKQLLHQEAEFADTVARLQAIIEGDLGGSLVQVGEDRLILLPAGFRGMKGIENEVFSPDE